MDWSYCQFIIQKRTFKFKSSLVQIITHWTLHRYHFKYGSLFNGSFSVILELFRDAKETKYSIWIYNRQWNRCEPVWQTKEQCDTIFKSMFHFSQSWCSRFSRISKGSWQVRFTDNKEDTKIHFCWIAFGICTYLCREIFAILHMKNTN